MSLGELFEKGGPVMYLLLACSLSVMAIAIDRWLFYKKAMKGSAALLARTAELARAPIAEARAGIGDNRSVAAFMLETGLAASERREDIAACLESAHGEAAMQLRARLNYLSMIVTLAPLLGLLGTIFGMIQSFNVFSLSAEQPLAITGGIGEALIATACGLCVAMFALVVHTALAERMDGVLTELDKAEAQTRAAFCARNGGAADAA